MVSPSTRFGPYEIVAPLGAGGMGEVYHAWDDRLMRAVAIKILPAHLANDPARLDRFVREACIAGRMNHPNVVSIHDVGGLEGTPYLVLELLEGETLREVLQRGPLPLATAVDTVLQVATGLAAIHALGIVHRDLKPENLFITRGGTVKILDFGLAQPTLDREDAPAVSDRPARPTPVSSHAPSGTIAYLSPEVVRGLPADHRSDLFAVGAVLYELATGVRAFAGETRDATMRAILEHDPLAACDAAGSPLPVTLERIVRHALEKDPDARFQSARDLAFALEPLTGRRAAGARNEPVATAGAAPSIGRWALPTALAAVIVAVGLTALPSGTAPLTTLRAVLPIEPRYDGHGLTVAPDGSRVVYSAVGEGTARLYVRPMNELTSQPIPGTDGSTDPFFSYDGQWVGFFANGKLKKVALSGGAPEVICNGAGRLGAAWGSDNSILFTPSIGEGLWRVSANGGTPRPVTTPNREAGEKSHRFAEWLPGGRVALFYTHFIEMSSLDAARIEAVDLESGVRRVLIEQGHRAQYLSTGHLVYQHGDSLLAVRFDPRELTVQGPPVEVLVGLRPSSWSLRQFAFSQNGLLVYAPGDEQALRRKLVWVDRSGSSREAISDVEAEFSMPRLSTDGNRLAVQIVGANDQTWMYEFDRDVWTKLTSRWDTTAPVWAPDGTRMAVASTIPGELNLFALEVDTEGESAPLATSTRSQRPTSWSPDGRHIAYTEWSPATSPDVWILDVATGSARPFLDTPVAEQDAVFSPDGRWIAYASDESGRLEVYVRPFAESGPRWQISSGGGQWPVWRRDGRELFYRTLAESALPLHLMSAPVAVGSAFRASTPVPLFEASRFGRYDISPDGERFLMVHYPQDLPKHFVVVSNWFEDVKRLVAGSSSRLERSRQAPVVARR